MPLSLPSWRGARRGPAVSVVVPAFNVGPYLRECLASIADQAVFPRCQVIVVDDGSTDDTLATARAAAAQWPQIDVVSQANRGPGAGAARNVGLAQARGEFVLFLDGDDALAPSGLDALHRAAVDTGAELTVGALVSFPEPRTYVWDAVFAGLSALASLPIEQAPLLIHNAAPGNKLMRTAVLRRLGLTFAEGIHHQDTYVTVPMMVLAPTITVLPDVVLRYRRGRTGSVMTTQFSRAASFFDHLQVVEHLSLLRPGLSDARRAVLDLFLARSMQGFVLRANELDPPGREEFVSRAATVYRQVSTEALVGATHTIDYRLAYSALLREDLDAIAASRELIRTVFAADNNLYAGVPVGSDGPDPLARIRSIVATLDTLRADGASVLAGGTVRVRGAVPVHELGVAVSLRLRGAGITRSASLEPTGQDGTRWTARLTDNEVGDGSYVVRMVLGTATGEVSFRIQVVDNLACSDSRHRSWVASDNRDGVGRVIVSPTPSSRSTAKH